MRTWDASEYERLAAPMTRWGADVVGWLDLHGDELALDAGCGTGRVTSMVLSRLPRGTVIALDASEEMLERARAKLVRFGDRVRYLRADLAQPIPIEWDLDAVLSTATFHWIADHDALFRNLAAVMRPGAQLAAQCGGAGNIARVEAAARAAGAPETAGRRYATVGETEDCLRASGYDEIEVWLHDEPTRIPEEDFEAYLATICLGPQVQALGPDEAERLVRSVAGALGEPEIDYVRLNIRARRSLR